MTNNADCKILKANCQYYFSTPMSNIVIDIVIYFWLTFLHLHIYAVTHPDTWGYCFLNVSGCFSDTLGRVGGWGYENIGNEMHFGKDICVFWKDFWKYSISFILFSFYVNCGTKKIGITFFEPLYRWKGTKTHLDTALTWFVIYDLCILWYSDMCTYNFKNHMLL